MVDVGEMSLGSFLVGEMLIRVDEMGGKGRAGLG